MGIRDWFKRNKNSERDIKNNLEGMSPAALALRERMVAKQREEFAVSGGNDSGICGNTESAILEGDISHLEAAVLDQKTKDVPATEYLAALNDNPKITDMAAFRQAVARGVQSNRVINKFFEQYTETLNAKLFGMRDLPPSKIRAAKKDIEGRLEVYSRFMYELKKQDASVDFDSLKFSDDTKDALWDQQKKLGVTFEMPIPAKYNGREPFELAGDAISVINCMNGYTKGYQGKVLRDLGPELDREK